MTAAPRRCSWPVQSHGDARGRIADGHVGRHARRARFAWHRGVRFVASTSPACAGCPTTTSPASASTADVAWLETPKGFARIEYKAMTLAEKSRAFVERVQARHNRWGLTADSQLRVAGDLSSNQMVSSDNDGLWTAMYVAAEAFRFKVTGAPDARANARRGMQAIVRLESDHRHSRVSRRGRSSRSAKTCSPRTASGTTRRTSSGAGRGTPAPTRSSGTISSIRSTTISSPTRARSRSCERCSTASPTTFSTTTTS